MKYITQRRRRRRKTLCAHIEREQEQWRNKKVECKFAHNKCHVMAIHINNSHCVYEFQLAHGFFSVTGPGRTRRFCSLEWDTELVHLLAYDNTFKRKYLAIYLGPHTWRTVNEGVCLSRLYYVFFCFSFGWLKYQLFHTRMFEKYYFGVTAHDISPTNTIRKWRGGGGTGTHNIAFNYIINSVTAT